MTIFELKLSSILFDNTLVKRLTETITEGIINGNIKIGITKVFALEYIDKALTKVPTQAKSIVPIVKTTINTKIEKPVFN